MDVRRYLAIVRARLPLLIASVLVAAVTAFVISGVVPKVYEARATLIVGQSLSTADPDYTQILASQRLSSTYASVATMRPLLDDVIAQLGLEGTADDLARRVRADAPSDSTLLTITAQDGDPGRASAIANALAEELILISPGLQGSQAEIQASVDADLRATREQIRSTEAEVAVLQRQSSRTPEEEARLDGLQSQLASLRATYASLLSFSSANGSGFLSVIQPAIPPDGPTSPQPFLNAVLGTLIGLMIAAAIVFGSAYLDDTFNDSDDVQVALELPTLGTITRMKSDGIKNEIYRLTTLVYPRARAAEAYRTLRSNIEFASVDAPIRTLLVTSTVPGEGKTVTAANLAVVFAQAGRRVLLVDADFRKPGVHLMFGLPNETGLTTLLRDTDTQLESIAQTTDQANLVVLTTGPMPPNPAELLGSQRTRTILQRLRDEYDLVVVDSPPLQPFTDAAVLSSFLEGTLFVIDAGRSRRSTVRHGREALAKADARVIGVVLNRVPERAASDYYQSDYYRFESAHIVAATESEKGA